MDHVTIDRTRLMIAFGGAVALSLGLSLVPSGRYLLYPFALLSTWAHEMGHGVTALLLGGTFERLELYSTLGGVAIHRGSYGRVGLTLISAAGLLGPALWGGGFVVAGARAKSARFVLAGLAAALALSGALVVRNLFGMTAIGLLAVAVGLLAVKGPEWCRIVATQMVGIQLCLGSLGDLDYMFTKTFVRNGQVQNSDTQVIAEQLFLPYWVWGAVIGALSLVILVAAFDVAWVRPEPASRANRKAG